MSFTQSFKLAILIYDLRAGGAERVVSILLQEYSNVENLQVHLVLLQSRVEYIIEKNTSLHILSKSELKDGVSTYLKIDSLSKKYAHYCLEKKIDISVSFMYKSNYINARSKHYNPGIKTILCERSYPSNSYPKRGLKNYIARKLLSYFYNKADLVITNSKLSAIDLKTNFNVVAPLDTIYNPFPILQVKRINKIKNRSYVFINVANLYDYKNQDLIIESFSKIKNKDSQLWIIGQGEMRAKLVNQIKSLNLIDRVFLMGYKKDPSVYLSLADCFVLASGHEGFPNVLLEAMNYGLSIISSDCQSGPREILAPRSNIESILSSDIEVAEYGILVPVRKTEELTKAMEMIIEGESLAAEYKLKAESRIKDFDSNKISKQFLELITNV